MATAQPTDVLQFLCWLHSCEERRCIVVHDVDFGEIDWDRHTHGDVKGSKLMAQTVWPRFPPNKIRFKASSSILYERNPARSDLVTQCMTFTRSEQNKAGVRVKQAPTLLRSHLQDNIAPLRARLQGTIDLSEKLILARNIACSR